MTSLSRHDSHVLGLLRLALVTTRFRQTATETLKGSVLSIRGDYHDLHDCAIEDSTNLPPEKLTFQG